MLIKLINKLNLTLEMTLLSQKIDILHDMRRLNEQITMLKYLICIFICIFVILVNMSILSCLQDTRGCIFYLVSKILFESIFPNPGAPLVVQSIRRRNSHESVKNTAACAWDLRNEVIA